MSLRCGAMGWFAASDYEFFLLFVGFIKRLLPFTLTHISLASNFVDIGKQYKPRSDAPQNAASDQGLRCLLTKCSKICIRMEITFQQPLKRAQMGWSN